MFIIEKKFYEIKQTARLYNNKIIYNIDKFFFFFFRK